MTQDQENWLEYYLEHGDAQRAVKEAYPDCGDVSIASRASKLKSQFAEEIEQRLLDGYKKDAPQAVRIIKDLMTTAKQEAVKLKAAQDWLSRAGHDAAFKVEHNQKTETHEELQARLKAAMSELSQEELAPFLKVIGGNNLPEVQALMELATDKPQ